MSRITTLSRGTSSLEQFPLPPHVALTSEEYTQLWGLKPAVRGTVRLYGKLITTPRSELNLGRDYAFSGVNHPSAGDPSSTHPALARLLAYTAEHSALTGWSQMLLNFYDDGDQYISDHRDDEPHLLPGAPIYSYSFGATRDFVVKTLPSLTGDKERLVLPMPNNTCIVMRGDMQQYYTHGVPKRKRVKQSRINVTLRQWKQPVLGA